MTASVNFVQDGYQYHAVRHANGALEVTHNGVRTGSLKIIIRAAELLEARDPANAPPKSAGDSAGRFCPACDADLVGNDPHGPGCSFQAIADGGGRATNAVITALVLVAQEWENGTGFGKDAEDRFAENVPFVNPGQLRDLADALASLAATPSDPLAEHNELVAQVCSDCGGPVVPNTFGDMVCSTSTCFLYGIVDEDAPGDESPLAAFHREEGAK